MDYEGLASAEFATERKYLPGSSGGRRMDRHDGDRRQLLRDAAVATVLVSVALALSRLYVEPWVLRLPGMILYIPFLAVYSFLEGRTENTMGSSVVQLAVYAVVVGLVVAYLARYCGA